jgi:hypothetical protein
MSPASYLTAPPRVAALIVATLVTIDSMWDWAIWGSLIVVFLAGVAALFLVVVRAREAWRDVGQTGRDTVRKLDDITAKAETTADRLETAGDTAELQESLGRLRVSLARLTVLTDALDEVQDGVARVAAVLPRK